MQALCEAAVDVALGAGASYADARAVSLRRQLVVTKNRNVDDVSDAESEGIGVRVLVDGAWGFAADRRGGSLARIPHLAGDRGAARRRRRRLDASRELEPDAPRPHDESQPRAR